MIIGSVFGMVDVRGNDRAAARHLVADELRRDGVRNVRAERLAAQGTEAGFEI